MNNLESLPPGFTFRCFMRKIRAVVGWIRAVAIFEE